MANGSGWSWVWLQTKGNDGEKRGTDRNYSMASFRLLTELVDPSPVLTGAGEPKEPKQVHRFLKFPPALPEKAVSGWSLALGNAAGLPA